MGTLPTREDSQSKNHAQTPWNAPHHMDRMLVFLLYFCLVQGKAAEMKFLVPQGAQRFGKGQSRDFRN